AMYASTAISSGMKGATKAIVAMNKEMAPAKQMKVIKEFQKQSSQMDMTLQMLSESIDETLDKDEAEEETEELTNQLSSAPKGRLTSKKVGNVSARSVPFNLYISSIEMYLIQTSSTEAPPDVEDLKKRMASLRRI
ncbi:Vacuolar protein sorting-associated protein 2-like protein, partial [Thalictrum thalictroides]